MMELLAWLEGQRSVTASSLDLWAAVCQKIVTSEGKFWNLWNKSEWLMECCKLFFICVQVANYMYFGMANSDGILW